MKNPMDVFNEEAPEVSAAFDSLIKTLRLSKGLDEKTKQLIYISLKAAEGDKIALSFHVPMAKKLGATKAEVADAIILTLTVCGLKGITTCLSEAMSFFQGDDGAV